MAKPADLIFTIREENGNPVDIDAIKTMIADYAAMNSSVAVSYSFTSKEVSWVETSSEGSKEGHEKITLENGLVDRYTAHIPGGELTVTKYGMHFTWSAPPLRRR